MSATSPHATIPLARSFKAIGSEFLGNWMAMLGLIAVFLLACRMDEEDARLLQAAYPGYYAMDASHPMAGESRPRAEALKRR